MTTAHPKVVVIGGGTGLPVLLRGLKYYPIDITAIVTVADDGGSSGRLREELGIPAPGDIRNVLVALSRVEPLVEDLFQHRFSSGDQLTGHALGNLILAAMTSITGNFVHAIQEMSKVLNVSGNVLPSANKSVMLHAKMEDGTVVSGESMIPQAEKTIDRVFLTPETIEPVEETIEAIREADIVVLGPGSLFTSIIPNLLVPQIAEELCKSTAKKIYVCNVMTQLGETHDYKASDHVLAMYKHVPRPFLNTIIVHNGEIPKEIQTKYKEEKAIPVDYDRRTLEKLGLHVIADDFIQYDGDVIRHNTRKVAQTIFSLLHQE
ncbi:gluconeogenesis factor YvcK family protein [Priestia endophytica]|jgi:uncharacterized cofD-like protein|uniref:gluconeogenesis factor YvcK family protein n=1 Tax=Priestia endophytica TaxID=135735 RepID=UPI000F53ACCC|nr:YvcK family protein [Priestia endophytica]MED4071291.1 YvcK family protein [Priestia endophytica]RPK08836.1 hypothetical protein FH5_04637 [Priestia endophytica]